MSAMRPFLVRLSGVRTTIIARLACIPAGLRRPVSGGSYRPEIDGLRFFAIAIVVVGHLAERMVRFFPAARHTADGTPVGDFLQRPGLGVYLFFAVSGFVLASQAARARQHPLSRPFLQRYFSRRLLRIEPPYLLLLSATFALIAITGFAPEGAHQFDAAPRSLTASLVGSVFYSHDLVWGTYPRLFPPGWSLEVEVQFYILAPLLFALWLLCRHAGQRLLLGTIGLIGGSALSLLTPQTIGPAHVGMSLMQFAHFFWLGLILLHAQPWIVATLARAPRFVPDVLGWGGLTVYLVLPNAPAPETVPAFMIGFALRAAALASVAAMFAGVFALSSFKRFCANPWISVIGGACYSLYLTHLQIIQIITAVSARLMPDAGLTTLVIISVAQIGLVLCAGLTFYAVVERTFMRADWPAALWERLHPVRPLRAVDR